MTGVIVSQRCLDCDFAPGEGLGSRRALRAILSDFAEIAMEHAYHNHGHSVVTAVDGQDKRVHSFGTPPAGSVECDQCHARIHKASAVYWEDIVLCGTCSGLDACRCQHERSQHEPFDGECLLCSCEHFQGEL